MRICLDIDDTITYAPELFCTLLSAMPDAHVIVVTFRTDYEAAEKLLGELGIRYDRLIVSTDNEYGRLGAEDLSDWKARIVNQLEPNWFFEDMPEVVCQIRPETHTFMPCDEIIREWLGTKTGRR